MEGSCNISQMSPLADCTASHDQKGNYRHAEVGKMDLKLLRFCLLLQICEPVHDISFEATKQTNKEKEYITKRWSRKTYIVGLWTGGCKQMCIDI